LPMSPRATKRQSTQTVPDIRAISAVSVNKTEISRRCWKFRAEPNKFGFNPLSGRLERRRINGTHHFEMTSRGRKLDAAYVQLKEAARPMDDEWLPSEEFTLAANPFLMTHLRVNHGA
jgi:hypothetical protein